MLNHPPGLALFGISPDHVLLKLSKMNDLELPTPFGGNLSYPWFVLFVFGGGVFWLIPLFLSLLSFFVSFFFFKIKPYSLFLPKCNKSSYKWHTDICCHKDQQDTCLTLNFIDTPEWGPGKQHSFREKWEKLLLFHSAPFFVPGRSSSEKMDIFLLLFWERGVMR